MTPYIMYSVMTVKDAPYRLRIAAFMDSGDAWGRELGRKVFKALDDALFASPADAHIVKIDFDGMKRIDVSFPQEAVVELIRKYMGNRYFFLSGLEDQDIEENVSVALEKRDLSAIIRDSKGYRLTGKPLADDFQEILKLADEKEEIGSGEVVRRFDMTPQNAANKLAALWKMGLLQRDDRTSRGGGRENRYAKVG